MHLVEGIVLASTLIVASGIIWTKLVRPIAMLITLHNRLLPLLIQMVKQFEDTPGVFSTLNEIAEQFRPNKGTSLHDVIGRIEASLKLLEGKAGTMEKRDEEDRDRAARIDQRLADLAGRVQIQTEQAGNRGKAIEKLAAKVDEALPTIEKER